MDSPPSRGVIVVSVSNSNNELVFNPTTINANVRDTVQFQFKSGNHSVARSDFESPCVPAVGGFFSGFVPAAAALARGEMNVYSVVINDTAPMAFYCAQNNHCQLGMVGVINPSGDDNFDNLKKAAALAPENIPPNRTRNPTSRPTTSPTSTATTDQTPSPTAPGLGSPAGTPPGGQQSQQSQAPAGDSGFSRGIGVGIGVAVALVILAVLVAGWFVLRRRGRRRKEARAAAVRASLVRYKPELESIPASTPAASGSRSVYELDDAPQRAELAGNSRPIA